MTPLERSAVYRGFAEALRSPAGGADLLDEAVVPAPPPDPRAAERAFLSAFDPAVARRAVSLHASSHLAREQTDLFEELIRWYSHFGLKRRDGAELPDHAATMLGFLHFLTVQEHEHGGDAGALTNLRRAEHDFIARLMLPVAQALADKAASDTARYRALPAALAAFLEDELASLAQRTS